MLRVHLACWGRLLLPGSGVARPRALGRRPVLAAHALHDLPQRCVQATLALLLHRHARAAWAKAPHTSCQGQVLCAIFQLTMSPETAGPELCTPATGRAAASAKRGLNAEVSWPAGVSGSGISPAQPAACSSSASWDGAQCTPAVPAWAKGARSRLRRTLTGPCRHGWAALAHAPPLLRLLKPGIGLQQLRQLPVHPSAAEMRRI
jgi:hypothetical protein